MRNYLLLSFAAISFCLSPLSNANISLIEALKQENSSYYKTIEQNEQSVSSNNEKIAKAAKALADAKMTLAKYEESHKLAQEKYDENPSPANLKVLEMKADRKAIATKKIAAKESRLTELEVETTELTASFSSLNALIKRNNSKIAKLKSDAQERKLQAAIKAEKKSQAIIKAPSLPSTTETPKPTVKLAALNKNKIDPATLSNADTTTSSNTDNPTASAIAEIKAYLLGDVSQEPKIHRDTARIQRGEKTNITHLGGEIYRGEIELERGKHTINFSGSRFRINVSSENHKKTHVIYFDNRSKKRKMVYIEKSQAESI